mmetsp:Transcript_114/g.302  ORF Transcript_114/g.302 Transcript_114/m.302 type:complete len:412 (+) Transcript_114:116-1351(+)
MLMIENNNTTMNTFLDFRKTTSMGSNKNALAMKNNKCNNNSKSADATTKRSFAMGIGNSNSIEEKSNMMYTKFAFPFKLHSILENSSKHKLHDRYSSIISWLPSGKAFKIHKPKEFAAYIMPRYFNQTKYRSFQRQLYIYGFDRIKRKSKQGNGKGKEKSDDLSDEYNGAYFHRLFVRGESDLCLDMQRQKIKGTGLSNEERRKRSTGTSASKQQIRLPIVAGSCSFTTATANNTQTQTSSSTTSSTCCADQSSSSSMPFSKFKIFDDAQSPMPVSLSITPMLVDTVSTSAAINYALSTLQAKTLRPSIQNILKNDINKSINNYNINKSIDNYNKKNIINNIIGNSNSNNSRFDDAISRPREHTQTMTRMCSLDFLRSSTGEMNMSRRGSLLFDGDEVCFGNRKFYFTTEY